MVVIGVLNYKLDFCSSPNPLFKVSIEEVIEIGIKKHADYRVKCFIDTVK
jgi:hypothetical protein